MYWNSTTEIGLQLNKKKIIETVSEKVAAEP